MKPILTTTQVPARKYAAGWLIAIAMLASGAAALAQYQITYDPIDGLETNDITVTVTRGTNPSTPSSVTIQIVPGSALANQPGFPYWDYDDGDLPKTDTFAIPPSTPFSRDYIITINDDNFFEFEEDFFVQVLDGTTVLAEEQIILVSNDFNGGLSVVPDALNNEIIPLPDDQSLRGSIQVTSTTAPPGAGWRLVGETRWRPIGDTVNDILILDFSNGTAPDPHEIEFLPVPGYNLSFPGDNLDPLAKQVVLTDTSLSATIDVTYTQNFNNIGDLQVDLYPVDVRTSTPVGTWRIRNYDITPADGVDDAYIHGNILPLPAGFYEIYFDEVDDFEVPRPRIVQVIPRQKSIIEVTYLRNDAAGNADNSLEPLDFFNTTLSYDGIQATGQVRTNIAKATGVAIGRNAVLTTAQAIFNPKRLTSTYKIRWTLQRQTSSLIGSTENNPPPQVPRGWYIFNDYSSGLSDNNPGDITTTNLENSVAALFFTEPTARGGLAGYVGPNQTVINSGTPELEDTEVTKFLAGYGLSEDTGSASSQSDDGILLKSPELTDYLTPLNLEKTLYRGRRFSNLVSGSKVGSFLGSAIFVRDPVSFIDIPAGIVVGTGDFGSGEELVIRAFDPVLAEMVQRAIFSGASELIYTNTPTGTTIIESPAGGGLSQSTSSSSDGSTEEGGISILSGLGGGFGGSGGGGFGDEATTGSLAVTLDPGGAVALGAQWGFDAESPTYRDSGDQVDDLLAGDYNNLIYDEAGGYDSPTSNSYTIVSEQTTAATKSYTENEELSWIQSNFDSADWETSSIVSASANPDGDPYNNAVERALGGDPEVSEDLLGMTAAADSLSITVTPDTSQTDMTLTVYVGSTPSEATGKSTIGAQTNEGMTSWPTTGTDVTATNTGGGSWTIEDTNTGGARFMYIEATSSNPGYSP